MSVKGPMQILRAAAVSALFLLVAVTFSMPADAQSLTWKKLKLTSGLPARSGFASAYDPVSKKVVVFGGANQSGTLNETWVFDGAAWTQIATSIAPVARSGAAMAYDRRIRKVVLFGGSQGFGELSDTWLWDGATSSWTQANPTTVPGGASGPIMFTDPADGRVDMFGGFRGRFYSRDTFQWTGADWKLLNLDETKSPYPRSFAVVAGDPVRRNVVVFGGISDNWVVQNTWTWDGRAWKQESPGTQPPPLYFTTGAFDPRLQEVIVFGGGSAGVDQNTTWAWDGSVWKELSMGQSPAPRERFGTIWDPDTHQFLIFDGSLFNTNTYFGDTYQLSGK